MNIIDHQDVSVVKKWVRVEKARVRGYSYSITVPVISFGRRFVLFYATSETAYRQSILLLGLLDDLVYEMQSRARYTTLSRFLRRRHSAISKPTKVFPLPVGSCRATSGISSAVSA